MTEKKDNPSWWVGVSRDELVKAGKVLAKTPIPNTAKPRSDAAPLPTPKPKAPEFRRIPYPED